MSKSLAFGKYFSDLLKKANWLLITYILFAAGEFLLTFMIMDEMKNPESPLLSSSFQIYILPMLLIFGVINLLFILTISASILNKLGLSNKNEALGLPSGSVRALIALFLILIFAITVIFTQIQLRPYSYMFQNGTQRLIGPTTEQKDFSLQALTTISTLMVAVAGFYFGTKSTEGAKERKTEDIKVILEPKDLARVKKGERLLIKVKTEPENKVIDWQVDGDERESLVHEKPDEFIYKPSEKSKRPKDFVTLTFSVVERPDIQEKLFVTIDEN